MLCTFCGFSFPLFPFQECIPVPGVFITSGRTHTKQQVATYRTFLRGGGGHRLFVVLFSHCLQPVIQTQTPRMVLKAPSYYMTFLKGKKGRSVLSGKKMRGRGLPQSWNKDGKRQVPRIVVACTALLYLLRGYMREISLDLLRANLVFLRLSETQQLVGWERRCE